MHAYDLFYNKKFDDSFNLFRQVEAEVKWIVSLFPDKITGSEFEREMPDFMKEISIFKTKSNEEGNDKEKDTEKDTEKDNDNDKTEEQDPDRKPWEMVNEGNSYCLKNFKIFVKLLLYRNLAKCRMFDIFDKISNRY